MRGTRIVIRNSTLGRACLLNLVLALDAASQQTQATGAFVLSARLDAVSVLALPQNEQVLTDSPLSGSGTHPFLIQALAAVPPELTTMRMSAYFADADHALRSTASSGVTLPASAVRVWFGSGIEPSTPSSFADNGPLTNSVYFPKAVQGDASTESTESLSIQIDSDRLRSLPVRGYAGGYTGTLSLLVEAL